MMFRSGEKQERRRAGAAAAGAGVAEVTARLVLAAVIGAALLSGCADGNPLLADVEEMVKAVQSGNPPEAPVDLVATATGPTTVELTWIDASSNESSFQLQRRVETAAEWASAADGIGADAETFEDSGLSTDSTYHYRLRAANDAGTSSWTDEVSATPVRAPTVTLSTAQNPTNAMPATITIAFSEEVRGFEEGDIRVLQAGLNPGSLQTSNNEVFTVEITNPESDPAVITVDVPADVARDAGGTGNTAGSLDLAYDSSLLSAPTISSPSAGVYKSEQTLTISGESGNDLEYSLDGGATWAAYSGPVAISAEGSYLITARQIDAEGRVSLSASVISLELDLTAPDPPTVTGSSTPTTNRRPSWSWSSTDPDGSGTFRYKLDDPDFTFGATTVNQLSYTPGFDLAEGSHTLYVVESDEVGNWPEPGVYGAYTITVDLTEPNAPSVSGSNAVMDLTPTWNWSSGGGGNGTFRYELRDQNNSLIDGPREDASTWFTASSLDVGTYTLSVAEGDDAGNWSAPATHSLVVDVPAPSSGLSSDGGIEERHFEWDVVSDAYRYKISLSRYSSFSSSWSWYSFSSAVDVSVSLTHGETYYWRVATSAYDAGESFGPWSTTRSFTARYEIGDTGPGGGLIFRLANIIESNFYMEALPTSTSVGYPWGETGENISGAWSAAIGAGSGNTDDIVARYGSSGPYAAQYCYNLSYGGKSDWFLPSHGELELVYTNLYLEGYGDYELAWHWSSTEDSADLADQWVFNSDGLHDPRTKTNNFYVVPVRYVPN